MGSTRHVNVGENIRSKEMWEMGIKAGEQAAMDDVIVAGDAVHKCTSRAGRVGTTSTESSTVGVGMRYTMMNLQSGIGSISLMMNGCGRTVLGVESRAYVCFALDTENTLYTLVQPQDRLLYCAPILSVLAATSGLPGIFEKS